jgi:hypothetical protein
MEVEENIQTTTPGIPSEKTPLEGKDRGIGVIILNILLALVTVVLLGYIAYRNGYINLDNILNTQEKESTEEEEKPEDEDPLEKDTQEELLTVETHEGEYFSAVTPLGWGIVEHPDGKGTKMIAEGSKYTGLTGIQILKGTEEIMKIEGVSGIGFVGCPELPRFKDSSPSYEKEQKEITEEINEEIKFLDFTDTPYSEFKWLEERFRRVGAALYYDTVNGDEFFEPQCEVSFFRIEEFGFKDADGYKGDTYMYTISQNASEEDLETLDKILTSIVPN